MLNQHLAASMASTVTPREGLGWPDRSLSSAASDSQGSSALVCFLVQSSGCRCTTISFCSQPNSCKGSSEWMLGWFQTPCSLLQLQCCSLLLSELAIKPPPSGQDNLLWQQPLIPQPNNGHQSLLNHAIQTPTACAGSSKTPALGRTERSCKPRSAQSPSRAMTPLKVNISPATHPKASFPSATRTHCCASHRSGTLGLS